MKPQTLDKINEYIKNNKDYIENQFIKEIIEIRSISNKERIKLVNRVKNGDTNANKDLIYYSLKDILAVAINFYDENIQLVDLIEKGCLHIIGITRGINLDKYIYQNYLQTSLVNIFKKYKNNYYEKIHDDHIQDYKNSIKVSNNLSDNIFLKHDIENILSKSRLSDREVLVFKMRYIGFSLKEIGVLLKVSSNIISATYHNAIIKIVRYTNRNGLEDYINNIDDVKKTFWKKRYNRG